MFFLIFISLFSLIFYLVKFNINNKRDFLYNSSLPSLNLSLLTEEDSTVIKIVKMRKNFK